jgi:hypothetical protein
MRLASLFPAAIASLTLAGCAMSSGQARYVLVEKGSGVVSMPVTDKGYEERANRDKAVSLIAAKCGTRYEITREEEVEVGIVEETVFKNESAEKSNKSVIRGRKSEYRLWYRCQ